MSNRLEYLIKKEEEEKELSNKLRRDFSNSDHDIEGNFIAVLGRQFDNDYKFNKCLKPLWAGFYIKYNDLELMVDPGVNVLERTQRIGVNISKTNTLFISHAHTDHKNDTNVVSEMVAYQESPKLKILMSEKSLEEGAMSNYHIQLHDKEKDNLIILKNNVDIDINSSTSIKPIEVKHSIDGSFGFILSVGDMKIGYTADTGFYKTYKTKDGEFETSKVTDKNEIEGPGEIDHKLVKFFSDVDILIFNLHGVSFRKHTAHNLYHTTVKSAVDVLKGSNVKTCIFDHFNSTGCLGREFSEEVNDYIKQDTGKDTRMVGLDGLVIKLNLT